MSERIREIDVVMRAGMLLAADDLEERRVHVTVRVCNSERRRVDGAGARPREAPPGALHMIVICIDMCPLRGSAVACDGVSVCAFGE